MRTSATGICNRARPVLSRKAGRHSTVRRIPSGFSLLELLVVVFIIGILATMFTLSVGVTGADQELEREVDRLRAVLELASQEAIMQGREIGMRFYRDGYEFAAYHEDFVEYHDPDDEDDIDQSEWTMLGQEAGQSSWTVLKATVMNICVMSLIRISGTSRRYACIPVEISVLLSCN